MFFVTLRLRGEVKNTWPFGLSHGFHRRAAVWLLQSLLTMFTKWSHKSVQKTIMSLFIISLVALPYSWADEGYRQSSPLGVRQGDTFHKFKFKKPLEIPFSLFSKDAKRRIQKANTYFDRLVELVFVRGEIVKARTAYSLLKDDDVLKGVYEMVYDQEAPKTMVVGGEEWKSIDLNYCIALVNLRESNQKGFVLNISKPIIPELKVQKKVGVNWGDIVESAYNIFVELDLTERPNEATIRKYSDQIPQIYCLRHSSKSQATRVEDFVKVIGADKIESL